MARWRDPEPWVVPGWVVDAWVYGDPGGLADAWLDDMYERDQERWYEAFVVFLSTPAYTRPA